VPDNDRTDTGSIDPAIAESGYIRLAGADETVSDAISKVRPAVVHIKISQSGSSVLNTAQGGTTNDAVAGSIQDEINASGVIFNTKGYLVTNYHVLVNAQSITVIPFSYAAREYSARIVKTDPVNDIAVLKIDSNERFPVAVLGNSDHNKIADTVLAIGSPFGLEYTVTKGIISDDSREIIINGIKYSDMIQTDAAINKGSAGGPLVNIRGEVIGINTAIYAPTGIFTGISFAVPINKVKELLGEI